MELMSSKLENKPCYETSSLVLSHSREKEVLPLQEYILGDDQSQRRS